MYSNGNLWSALLTFIFTMKLIWDCIHKYLCSLIKKSRNKVIKKIMHYNYKTNVLHSLAKMR